MPYIGKAPSSGIRSRFIYTATASQTTFTGADGNGKTLGYTDGEYVDVYLNGVLLDPADYTATSKTSVVLDSGATVSDIVEIVVYDTFSVFNGTFTGDLTVDGDTLFVDASADAVGVNATTLDASLQIGALNNTGTNRGAVSIKTEASGATIGESAIYIEEQSGAEGYYVGVNLDGAMFFSNSGASTPTLLLGDDDNVGIGTTSPVRQLHVNAASGNNAYVHLTNATTGATTTDGFSIVVTDSNGEAILIQREAQPLSFRTSGTERMRIDSSGNLLVGTTSSPISSNKGTALLPSSLDRTIINMSSASVSSGVELIQFRNPNGQVGHIATNASSTTYATSSDYRLKENVTGITDGITRLKLLNPSRFNFIADADTTVDGFLAHEVSDIVPEAITGEKDAMKDEEYVATPATGEIYTPAQEATYDDDGNELTAAVDEIVHSTDVEQPDTLEEGRYWRETTQAVMATRSVPDYQGIDQSKLVPLLTAALQEAVTKIETLEARIVALENA